MGAVFLDRDGTLIVDEVYLADPDKVQLLPGVTGALRRLQEAGYMLVMVTNQSGINRGYFTEAEAHAVNGRVADVLRSEGIAIAATYMCPHRPDEGCDCRKPAPGMLTHAARDHGIDLASSAMVGDKDDDARAGLTAGCGLGIKLGDGETVPGGYVVADMPAAADLILERLGPATNDEV